MYIKSVKIRNYRMLLDTTIELDPNMTVIVGRNNTGKTSFIKLVRDTIGSGTALSYNDVPLSLRNNVKTLLCNLKNNKIGYDKFIESYPITQVDFLIDYTDDKEYGALANFILSLEENDNTAELLVKYQIIWTEEKIKGFFHTDEDINSIEKLEEFCKKGFRPVYYAVNHNHREYEKEVEFAKVKQLLSTEAILAERELGENENQKNDSLKRLIAKIFSSNDLLLLKGNEDNINSIKESIEVIRKNIQNDTDTNFSELIDNMIGFGYPGVNDLSLGIRTELEFEDYIENKARLVYKNKNDSYDLLPSDYNGLGYKNLLKIEFQILEYIENINDTYGVGIKILFIEEPESHMHPQMQRNFVKHIEDFVNSLKERCGIDNELHFQIILSTHSAQVANSVDFSKIRYIKRSKNNVEYKNLYDFYNNDKNNADFIHKYLTLSRCDVFFADKIILVEGTAERILIPDMIDKIDNNSSNPPVMQLKNQYYTILEIGGAYAHKFIPFMKFIDLPCLIITDIDAIKKDTREACLVSEGDETSNATIKHWFTNILKINDIHLIDILQLDDEKKIDDKMRVDYQVTEGKWCGRSLEEAIKNANKKLWEVKKEADLTFKEKKTNFALSLISDDKYNNYNVPKYIRQGIEWLEKQIVEG